MTSNKPGPPPTPHRAIRIGKNIWLILNFFPVASLKIGLYSTPHALLLGSRDAALKSTSLSLSRKSTYALNGAT